MFDVEDHALNEHEDSAAREEESFDPVAAEEELATLSSHLDAATYRQLVLIRQIDESGHWADAGATTCAAWLSWRIGMNENAARERLRIAHALRDLPKVADAMRTGTLSYSKVRAIVRVATPTMEDRLLEYARYTTASQLERICRGVRQQQLLDAEDGEPLDEAEQLRRAFDSRDLFLRARGDGTVQVVVTLMPDEAQRVFIAVETMREAMREECPSLPPTYADAFVRLVDVGFEEATVEVVNDSADLEAENHSAESNLDATNHSAESNLDATNHSAESNRETTNHSAESNLDATNHSAASNLAADEDAADHSAESYPSARRNEVSGGDTRRAESHSTGRRRKKVPGGDTQRVLIQLAPHLLSDGLVANLDDGTWIAPETWRRVACDCALDLVKVDEAGAVLDVGRRTRTIPPALSRALDVRDAGRCRFPGCNHRRFLDRHHLEHWSRNGETKLDNLLTLCDAHHRLVHEGGWTVELEDDEARFFRPDGTPLVWPAPPRVKDAVGELQEAHVQLGIAATTGLTSWNGKTPEYSWCVEVVCG
ncbi:MAG: HNH endonuclease [Myxococcota bacterium]|jgi:hypothetical protein|nr:HNH endonuclease [Myxococcota bacterium]